MNKDTLKEMSGIAKTRFGQAELGNTAVLVAFYILLSIFPIIILIGNIIPLLDIDPDAVISYLSMIVPEQVQSILDPIVKNLLTSGNAGILSISMLGLLWAASQGVAHLKYGIDKAYGLANTRSSLLQRIVAMIGLIVTLFIAVALVILLQLGDFLLDKLSSVIDIAETIDQVLGYVKWPLTIILLIILVMVIYKFMPSIKIKMRDVIPGSLITVIGWFILMETFGLYLHLTAKTFSTYGVLSTFFILMFWIDFAVMVLLAGAVINASIYTYKYGEPEVDEKNDTEEFEKKVFKKIKRKFDHK